MKKDISKHFEKLKDLFDNTVSTGRKGAVYQLDEAIKKSIKIIIEQTRLGRKLIFIGNGASASIASHQAVDFWKNAGIPAVSFNDAAGLTCISNDFGYEYVFAKPIEMFAKEGDILIAISSSGESQNIIKATEKAKEKKCTAITLSGFKESNRLRKLGDLNFYVPVEQYGFVEVIHHAICHCISDSIIKYKKQRSKKSG